MFNIGQNKPQESSVHIKTDYNPKVKFEINSLNGVLNNLLSELKHYKAEDCKSELEKFRKETPYFQKLIDSDFSRKCELENVSNSIKFLQSSNFLIKKEISQMKIIDKKGKDFNI